MSSIILICYLVLMLLVGNALYYLSGFLKKLGVTSIHEMNESELKIRVDGELVEVFPNELVDLKEARIINFVGRFSFILIGCMLWVFMAIITGRVAYLLQPSELFKLLVYFVVYFLVLRIPFGVVNRTIKKSYKLELMPEKLIFALTMIFFYVIGINYFEYLPRFLQLNFLG